MQLDEVNLIDHPFKRETSEDIHRNLTGFDASYFDDPDALTGFRGYTEEGNAAEGRRDFRAEAAELLRATDLTHHRPPPGDRAVLDVGCAKGFLVRHLRQLGVDAWGIDVSHYAIEAAPEEVRPFCRVCRVEDLEPGQRYEVIHVCGVLIYLELSQIRAALRVFRQITSRGLYLYEPTAEMFAGWWDARDVGALDPFRKQELPQATWDALVVEAGFEKVAPNWYVAR